MSSTSDRIKSILQEVVIYSIVIGSVYYGMKILDLMNIMNTEGGTIDKKLLAKKLRRPEIETMDFDSYETRFFNDIIAADQLDVGFDDIGGMNNELEEVKDNIVMPILLWSKFKNSPSVKDLTSCPNGVLLYGNPGTGKSYTAKAIAKEANATFFNIKASAIMDKFLGESDKLVSAIFRLARKLGPSVIFIDEIETVLRKRDSSSPFQSSAIPSMQGVFLSEWDGLNVDNDSIVDAKGVHENNHNPNSNAPVVVLGATNRPMDLDKAFLRRMPVQIQTKMPDAEARLAILQAQLRRSNETLDASVNLEELARCTENFTGSDLKELIRLAKQQRMKSLVLSSKEAMQMVTSDKESPSDMQLVQSLKNKPITNAHLSYGLQKTKATVSDTKKYGTEVVLNELAEKGYIIER